jgi:predicted acetylornithine/succinylornithine family transaminase
MLELVMTQGTIGRLFDGYVLGNYTRAPVAFVRGSGAWIWDAAGRRYLDFFPGHGAGALGHCHPAVVAAIRRQAGRLIHVANVYQFTGQGELAQLLLKLAGFRGKVFFGNSGAEANEAAIKLARRYAQLVRKTGRFRIVTIRGSFHGRTYGALAATGQKQYHAGFDPMPGGFVHVPLNDVVAARKAVDSRTCAVLIEPVLGEGGVLVPDRGYLKLLRKLTRRAGALLMFDEVQTGCGRTGTFYAFEQSGVIPDVVTLAKPLAGGLPIGAMIVREPFAAGLAPGSHASTFGGSPLVCAAGLAAVRFASAPRTLARVRRMGGILGRGLESIRARHPGLVSEIRGPGLMKGIELVLPGDWIVKRCRELGLLINCTHGTVLRIYPPMTVTERQVSHGLSILSRVLDEEASRNA